MRSLIRGLSVALPHCDLYYCLCVCIRIKCIICAEFHIPIKGNTLATLFDSWNLHVGCVCVKCKNLAVNILRMINHRHVFFISFFSSLFLIYGWYSRMNFNQFLPSCCVHYIFSPHFETTDVNHLGTPGGSRSAKVIWRSEADFVQWLIYLMLCGEGGHPGHPSRGHREWWWMFN